MKTETGSSAQKTVLVFLIVVAGRHVAAKQQMAAQNDSAKTTDSFRSAAVRTSPEQAPYH